MHAKQALCRSCAGSMWAVSYRTAGSHLSVQGPSYRTALKPTSKPDDRNATMNKIFATLLIGVGLFGAAPVFAGNEADIIQEGGGENYIEAEQRGRDNDFASSQDGTVNTLGLKQRGRNNKAQAHQNGDDNAVFLDQKSSRRK